MENKSEAVRREILKYLIDGYGNKGKKVIILKAKEKGVYKSYVSDEEIYEQIKKFAEFHNLTLSEPVEIIKEDVEKITIEKMPEEIIEDEFYINLQKEHSKLSKKILAINKLMELYKNESLCQ